MRLVPTLILMSTLSVCGRPDAPAPLEVGGSQEGTLTDEDFDQTYGVIADALPLRYPGGQPVAVVVTSEVMDPFAIVASRGAPVGADAGKAGGQGACVVLEAPHPLDVQVYVSSAGAAPYGDYRVSVLAASDAVVAEHDCQSGDPPNDPPQGQTLTEVSRLGPTPVGERALTDS